MKRQVWLTTLIGLLAIGCGDDVSSATDTDTDTDGTSTGDTMPSTTMTMSGPTTDPSTSTTDPSTSTDPTVADSSTTEVDPTDPGTSSSTTDDTNTGEPVDFIVTVENISGESLIPTPFSPGVWANHDASVEPIYSSNTAASPGLELLAEDGDPSELATEVEATTVFSSGAFGDAPIADGESYEFEFTAEPGSRLSLATMFVASNDVYVGTGPLGVSLFLGNGNPIDRDITNSLALYDAGTEANQPPGGGGYQPPNLESYAESGVVSPRNESTRSIPASRRLIDVDVDLEVGTSNYTITFTNISDETGGLLTPLSPFAWATHDDTISIVTPGGSADDLAGLEALAEDGDPNALVATLGASAAVDQSGALGDGPILPGESVSFMLTPTTDGRFLSFATMVVDSNDAFIAPGAAGIQLLEEDGTPRSAAVLTNEIVELLAVWDAGTEANETPGVGANQVQQQGPAGDVGPDDPDATIRLYSDNTNDLADIASNLVVSVTSNEVVPEIFTISITQNFTDELGAMTAGSAFLTPMVWGLSDGSVPFFTIGEAASPGLEELAEDGMAAGFDQELEDAGADSHAIVTPAGPLFTIVVTASAEASVFNIASMIVPSNDTFISLGADGIDLFDGGAALTAEEVEAAIIAALGVYDAGTEQNQAGMSGRDMASLQAGGNTGASEGTGLIRNVTAGSSGVFDNEPVWSYGDPEQMIRVTVSPAR